MEFWTFLAFAGLHWPLWPFLAFHDFLRPKLGFLCQNQIPLVYFLYPDIENSFHIRITNPVHSGFATFFSADYTSLNCFKELRVNWLSTNSTILWFKYCLHSDVNPDHWSTRSWFNFFPQIQIHSNLKFDLIWLKISNIKIQNSNSGLFWFLLLNFKFSETLTFESRNLSFSLTAKTVYRLIFVRSSSFCRTWGEHVVYKNCFECQKQFLYTTCSPQVWAWNFYVLNAECNK